MLSLVVYNEMEEIYVDDTIVIDGLTSYQRAPADLGYIRRAQKAGVSAMHASLVGDDLPDLYETLQRISSWLSAFKTRAEVFTSVLKADDIVSAKEQKKMGIIMGLQSTKPLTNDVWLLDILYELGIRIVQLTYQRRCWVGSGCSEETDEGLSRFGREVVKRLNQLGIVIDASHCGDKTCWDAIEYSAKPIAFTHTGPRTLCNVARNKTDALIRRLAERNGVMGFAVYSNFLSRGAESTVDDFIDTIDYVVQMVGIDYVGLGLDYTPDLTPEYWARWTAANPDLGRDVVFGTDSQHPEALRDIDRFLPQLTLQLSRRGYDAGSIKKLLGLNFLRLYREVWGE